MNYHCRLCNHNSLRTALTLNSAPRNVQRLFKSEELHLDHTVVLDVLECNKCGFVQIEPLLNDDYYDDYMMVTTHSAQMQKFQETQSHEFVRRFCLENMRIIEIGCGDGNYLDHLRSAGALVAGVEPSSVERKIALEKGNTVYPGYVSATRKIENGLYDAFVTRQVLEHIPDIHDFLQGIKVNLNSGAYGLVEVPSLEKAFVDRRFYDFFPDHVNYFSQRTLRVALEMNGFEVLEVSDGMFGEYNVAIVKLANNDQMSQIQHSVQSLSREIESFITERKAEGDVVAIWGAGGKGLSVMSSADVSQVDVLIDGDPHKKDLYSPGSHLQVRYPSILKEIKVDAIIITAMAYKDEIIRSLHEEYNFRGTIALLGHSLKIIN